MKLLFLLLSKLIWWKEKTENCLICNYCTKDEKKFIDNKKVDTIYIIHQGHPVFGIYFICKGKVKVYKRGPRNKEQIIRLAKTGDILGHRGYGGELVYPIGARALEDSYIAFFENDLFIKISKNNALFSYNLMMFYADELKKSEMKVRNMGLMNFKEKVVDALLYIFSVYGTKNFVEC